MNWFFVLLLIQFTMSGETSSSPPHEPPELVEDTGTSGVINIQDITDTDNCQSMSYQEIMMKNKFDLKKKEEEVQVFIRFLYLMV